MPSRLPEACVLGGVDLVQALGAAGIPSVVVSAPGDPARLSRWATDRLDAPDHWQEGDLLVRRLMTHGSAQPHKQALYYDNDGDLLLVAAHREELGRAFRFVLPDPELVLATVDKVRFRRLADELGLPVPRSALLTAGGPLGEVADLRFPVVVKPVTRRTLLALDAAAKAVRLDSLAALVSARSQLARAGDTLVQELVPGSEDRIESYHAYVDEEGAVAGEFTGAKIRTWPASFGHSCALVTTARDDVRDLGRALTARLGLRGVVKLDLKRDPDGRLWLLEVNPRFTLWHHLGAMAGVNLAAIVHADLMGRPRPPSATARAGVTWCEPIKDLRAARAAGVGTAAWLRFIASCGARSGAGRRDLAPLVRGIVLPAARSRSVDRLRAGHRQVVEATPASPGGVHALRDPG